MTLSVWRVYWVERDQDNYDVIRHDDELYETEEQAQEVANDYNNTRATYVEQHIFRNAHAEWESKVAEFDVLVRAGLRKSEHRPKEPMFNPAEWEKWDPYSSRRKVEEIEVICAQKGQA